ncbi:MAG TPA: isoprenylcysteine carboxylmethyltransferase family protein [Pyrinomonadaceae bacterium]|nr:isoprenylcysteine carboxylmethyltransferase family protein [Pyrinomonadaceae bacterium]
MIPILATILRVVWIAIEVPYVRRFKVRARRDWDKRSAQLWDIANALELIGMVLGFTQLGRITTGSNFISSLGLLFLVAGVGIRWNAIHTLGKYFTSTVVIKDDHCLVRTGLYRYLRHPAYTGALIAHLGLGLAFSNWFSLALGVVPFLAAAMYRIQVEERALQEAFGEEYSEYSRYTKRLIPKLY